MVLARVEQFRTRRGRRVVEIGGVEQLPHPGPLRRLQCARLHPLGVRGGCRARQRRADPVVPIPARPRHPGDPGTPAPAANSSYALSCATVNLSLPTTVPGPGCAAPASVLATASVGRDGRRGPTGTGSRRGDGVADDGIADGGGHRVLPRSMPGLLVAS